MTGRLAGRFKTERLVKTGMDPRTANRLLSGLQCYWTWLEKHEHVDSNPWAGKSLPKRKASSDERERAFDDDEVRRLVDDSLRHLHHLHSALDPVIVPCLGEPSGAALSFE